jgi:hypothetical protein
MLRITAAEQQGIVVKSGVAAALALSHFNSFAQKMITKRSITDKASSGSGGAK